MGTLSWNTNTTPKELQTALRLLAEEYPLVENREADLRIEFKHVASDGRSCGISRNGSTALIEYSDLTAALRGVGSLLARIDSCQEQTSFKTFGIMLDCSRNAVMKVDHFKGWLRKLALLGYNMAMLYTEDTYQIPGEPYFGYQRGAYTPEELREIDAYAASLGIEMIPCIQTLGHLSQILKWSAYDEVRDTSSVLLVGQEKTYELIEKMIRQCASTFRSRRIHIGMDEAHDLGRGRYMDLFGYKRGFDLFNEHLARVTNMCKKYQLKSMIWSDMYFRMGSKTQDYYDTQCQIPDDVKRQIPHDVELVYWDYYHDNEAFYIDWINRHRDLGFEPIMGSGVWSWGLLWYSRDITETTAGPCIRASLKQGLSEIIFTLWGDDGAFCDFDSIFAGLAWTAELAYTGQETPGTLAPRFSAICHADYNDILTAADLRVPQHLMGYELLWDDPILGLFWHNKKLQNQNFWQNIKSHYDQLAKKLDNAKTLRHDAGDLQHALRLTQFLAAKIDLRMKLESAYAARDKDALSNVLKEIPRSMTLLDKIDNSFRTQWLRRNKPFGLEVIQIRLAAQRRRLQELAQRIDDLLQNRTSQIDELENLPTVALKTMRAEFHRLATSSSIL